MRKQSAGILLFRRRDAVLEVLLAHPGGPYWKNKDSGAWTVPKGEYLDSEDALAAAKRELEEEIGLKADGQFIPLGEIKQPGGKIVKAWAFESDFDVSQLKSNLFSLELPPRSGKFKEFPEIDKAQWFSPSEALEKILHAQREFITRLTVYLEAER